jgi:hypothetical protein
LKNKYDGIKSQKRIRRRLAASALTVVILSINIIGCGNTNSVLSARKNISSPSEALVGHWAEEYGDTDYYFDGNHFSSFIEDRYEDEMIVSLDYTIENEDPVQFMVEIAYKVEIDVLEGEEPPLIHRIEFSDDRNKITMKYWDEAMQEFIETESSKSSIIYIDDKLSP